ncbi:MAG: cobaltochelatase CobT-related protein [Hominisplanchenecus sp.]
MIGLDDEAIAKMNSYIELNYGRSYLTPLEAERINHQICTGAHADCTLYFTDGILANMVKVNAQSEYARRTKEVNWRVYEQNRRMAKQNIDMLTNVLKRALVARNEKETYVGESGRILPNRLWNIGRTENRKLFLQESRRYNTDFVVEVLIDGSGSQRSRQSHVALQAFMISEALTNVGIPHRVMSFCTFWDYTVMRRFREYEDGREANLRIFEFYGSSNNRDGLAVRAAAAGLLKRDEENKILIVLSDGRPNDIVVNRPNSRNPRPYFGDYGTKDTAMEVRHLRNAGVSVLGVFTGEEGDLQAERRIFGKDFAYIRRIDNFSAVVGRYLKKQLEETCN